MIWLVLLLAADADPLVDLRASYENADCESVVARTAALDAFATEARREATFMRGDCLVTIGNIREATLLFKTIFLESLDAQVPFEVEPRVAILIEAARAEVAKLRAQEEAAARAKRIESIALLVREPTELKGGSRAMFGVELTDPEGLVRSMRVDFRKQGAPEFYALPIERKPDGTWEGAIPGTYTKSANGAVLEWYVTVSDERGEKLKSFGSRDDARTLVILPGSVVAEDLKANERMAYATRIIVGALATPLFSGMGVVSGLLTGVLGSITPDASGGPVLVFIGYGLLPLVGGTLGTLLVATTVLDLKDAILVATIVGSVFLVGEVAVAVAALNPSENAAPIAIAALAIAGGVVASGIVTPIVVAFDPPEE